MPSKSLLPAGKCSSVKNAAWPAAKLGVLVVAPENSRAAAKQRFAPRGNSLSFQTLPLLEGWPLDQDRSRPLAQ